LPFLVELVPRALNSLLASAGATRFSIAASASAVLVIALKALFARGSWPEKWKKACQNWTKTLLGGGVIGVIALYTIVYAYYLFYGVPHKIRERADSTPPPVYRLPPPAPPEFAYARSAASRPTPGSLSASLAVDDLRERRLQLSTNILKFLRDRQRNAPADGPTPRFSYVGSEHLPGITPLYMRETLSMFNSRFEGRITDIHDEFSKRGLQDHRLEAVYKHLPEISGNVDTVIGSIAESIRKLAILTPPKDLYKDVSNVRLSQTALEEADNMEQRAMTASSELSGPQPPAAVREYFYDEFKECCLSQVVYLRAELMRRLGPAAQDPEEMRAFNGTGGIAEIDKHPTDCLAAVLHYAPRFRELARKMRDK
ncbi:MAG: hypothetical protein ACRD3T_21440, partial [Terriglobia bacterium]